MVLLCSLPSIQIISDQQPTYTYTFENVIANHTIEAVFYPGTLTYTITPVSNRYGWNNRSFRACVCSAAWLSIIHYYS